MACIFSGLFGARPEVEQCCTGAIYAQIIDAIHPGKVPMSKLKWAARTEPDYIHNFKVLQQALNSLNVTRAVDVQKLVRGKYQDNLEMLQWFHCYYDRNGPSADYDPVQLAFFCRLYPQEDVEQWRLAEL